MDTMPNEQLMKIEILITEDRVPPNDALMRLYDEENKLVRHRNSLSYTDGVLYDFDNTHRRPETPRMAILAALLNSRAKVEELRWYYYHKENDHYEEQKVAFNIDCLGPKPSARGAYFYIGPVIQAALSILEGASGTNAELVRTRLNSWLNDYRENPYKSEYCQV